MRKTLGIALAAALIFPSQASAELFNNLKVSGQLDIQSTSARNAFDFQTGIDSCTPVGNCTTAIGANNDNAGATLTRTMVNAEWDLLDDVHAQIGLVKNNRAWGRIGLGTGDQVGAAMHGGQPIGADGAGTVLGGVWVNLANVKIDKMFGHFDFTVGRQYYGDPGDLVYYVGPYDSYGLYVNGQDALRVDAENDMLTFSGVFATTAHDGDITSGSTDANTYIKGVEVGIKNMPVKSKFFVWNQLTQYRTSALGVPPSGTGAAITQGGLNDNLYVYGLKLRGEAAGGWLSLDLAGNLGSDRTSGATNTTNYGARCSAANGTCFAGTAKYRGWGFLLDTGYNAEIANVGGFTPWGTFGLGTGRSSAMENTNEDFQTMSTDFRPGVINRRFGGMNPTANALGSALYGINANRTIDGNAHVATNGLSNRVVWGAGANFTPAFEDRATMGLSFWDFRYQRVTDYGQGARRHAGNRHIGSEIGVTGEWRHSENVTLGMGWATFQPGGYIKELVEDDKEFGLTQGVGINPVSLWYADFTVKF